jgi:OPA family glycerol-3-phosphate transporter-like MFS transporter
MLSTIRRIFAAAPHKPRLPDDEVRRLYPRMRWQILEATFIGYAFFYLVRNNLSVVAKDMQGALHYNQSMIGTILAVTAMSYGLGKFLMGAVSDRSNARVFMAFGLFLTAVCNFAFGGIANYSVHVALWAINGFFQGMGWPPCGRCMGHWFSEKERGLTFSIWNTSHNVGGGVAGVVAAWAATRYGGWQFAFYVPGAMALVGAVYLLVRLRDTPQSVGLPPIEEYRNDYPVKVSEDHERELTFRELFVDYVLTNKFIWLLAIGNFFAYVTRYSMLDWGPMYLREVKGATLAGGGMAVFMTEFGGIPSTILLGWVSDLLKGRRGMVAVLCLVPILLAFTAIMLTPAGYLWFDMLMLATVGFFIYPVINLIVIMALDLTSKKAIGTAAGFIGLFGYIGRTAQAKGFGWILHHYEPVYGKEIAWQIVLVAILACTLLALVLLAFTWNARPRSAVIGICPNCDYSLHGNVSGVCPECGRPVTTPVPVGG